MTFEKTSAMGRSGLDSEDLGDAVASLLGDWVEMCQKRSRTSKPPVREEIW